MIKLNKKDLKLIHVIHFSESMRTKIKKEFRNRDDSELFLKIEFSTWRVKELIRINGISYKINYMLNQILLPVKQYYVDFSAYKQFEEDKNDEEEY